MVFDKVLLLDTKNVLFINKPSHSEFASFLDAFVTIYYGHEQNKVASIDCATTINIPLKLIHELPENRLCVFAAMIVDPHFCENYLDNHKYNIASNPDFIINHRFLRQFIQRFNKPNRIFDLVYYIIYWIFYGIWIIGKYGLLFILYTIDLLLSAWRPKK